MKYNKGFTVIELVVAVTIVLLLIAVAIASFHDHMTRKYRAEARKALIENAEWLQFQHRKSGTYLVKLPVTQTPNEGDARYRIELVSSPLTATDPKVQFPAASVDAFTLRAVPMSGDTCGNLLLDSTGRTGVSDTAARVADCWH
jgi:type IV pilus assembly protein PilE